jgi:hypothetical protein
MNDTQPRKNNHDIRLRLGLITLAIGLVIFTLGVKPSLFGIDRSPVTGFVQLAVLLIGLALMCIGGYAALNPFWNGSQKSIIADIGLRVVATGYVIAVVASLADIFGFGSQPFPRVPSFGPVQALGVMLGEAAIAIGFLLFIHYPDRRRHENEERVG